MKFFTVVGLFCVSFATTSADLGDNDYSSVCEGCATAAPITIGLSSFAFVLLKPVFYMTCRNSKHVNSSVDVSFLADINSPTFESDCIARIDYGFEEAVRFAMGLASSPEKTSEFCRILSCENPKFEEINQRIFKDQSEGNLELACKTCQQALPEVLKIFEEPDMKENFENFAQSKFCPRFSNFEQCKKVIDFVLPKLVSSIHEYSTDSQQMCALFGACVGETEETAKRSQDEL